MKNKVLINLYVASLNEEFDVFIPINDRLINILKELTKALETITDGEFLVEKSNYSLFNAKTGTMYSLEQLVRETDIRNATKLIII